LKVKDFFFLARRRDIRLTPFSNVYQFYENTLTVAVKEKDISMMLAELLPIDGIIRPLKQQARFLPPKRKPSSNQIFFRSTETVSQIQNKLPRRVPT
jgi:hypothetical protein